MVVLPCKALVDRRLEVLAVGNSEILRLAVLSSPSPRSYFYWHGFKWWLAIAPWQWQRPWAHLLRAA